MFMISVLSSIGLSILLVEKAEDWPVSIFIPFLHNLLGDFHKKLPEMLNCTICTSFWASLVIDAFLFIATSGSYFMWPLTGFASAGLVWILYQVLNAVDKNGEAKDEEGNEGEDIQV